MNNYHPPKRKFTSMYSKNAGCAFGGSTHRILCFCLEEVEIYKFLFMNTTAARSRI